jgi:hypothetical protein
MANGKDKRLKKEEDARQSKSLGSLSGPVLINAG